MPMTMLYGLSKLNEDDTWTRKQTLTVHVIGANIREVSCGPVFEEILHRLPEVNTLDLILCGPKVPIRDSFDHEICSMYHDFVRKQGNQYETPDLRIAFNSGAAQVGDTCRTSVKVLAERKLPSLLTAYDRKEAEGDAAMLRAAGVALNPLLGPCLNPWGSQKALPTAHSVYGFHVVNGWLAGGFK
ncbi:hypothetical protein K438DRAFT_1751270 [Mycena galopus ATCC 62051]|nr:hypothetical protein K438DRAFT_1751270 [Mycena galopus ATCC 62051]